MRVQLNTIMGLAEAITGAKYPMLTDIDMATPTITDGIKSLGKSAIGSGHDNFLNGIVVMFDLTCSNKMWVEAQRYHFLDFVSSQSTMHRITKMDISQQCNHRVWTTTIEALERLVALYNSTPEDEVETRNEMYLEILYNIPSGFELTARMVTNYRQLKTIYHQRKNHRLPEWREFCKWIEELPNFKELCLK